MRRDERNDLLILHALRRPASVLEISRELLMQRSSIYSALVSRKGSLFSRGYVERIGSMFQITDEGRNRHDFLVEVANEEQAQPANKELHKEQRSFALMHDFEDVKNKETLGFSFWLSDSVLTGMTRYTSEGALDQGEDPVRMRKLLYRWLKRPVDSERLIPGTAREDGGTVLRNRDYLAFAMLTLVKAVLDQRRRLVTARPQHFNDIVVVHSKHLGKLREGELEEGLRRILGLRPLHLKSRRKA